MRCMRCGAEMTLIGVVEDDTFKLVRGFEHTTRTCVQSAVTLSGASSLTNTLKNPTPRRCPFFRRHLLRPL